MKDFRLECFCHLLTCILLCNNSVVQFRWSLAPKFLAGFFLNASIISLLNSFGGCGQNFQFVLVLVG